MAARLLDTTRKVVPHNSSAALPASQDSTPRRLQDSPASHNSKVLLANPASLDILVRLDSTDSPDSKDLLGSLDMDSRRLGSSAGPDSIPRIRDPLAPSPARLALTADPDSMVEFPLRREDPVATVPRQPLEARRPSLAHRLLADHRVATLPLRRPEDREDTPLVRLPDSILLARLLDSTLPARLRDIRDPTVDRPNRSTTQVDPAALLLDRRLPRVDLRLLLTLLLDISPMGPRPSSRLSL